MQIPMLAGHWLFRFLFHAACSCQIHYKEKSAFGRGNGVGDPSAMHAAVQRLLP